MNLFWQDAFRQRYNQKVTYEHRIFNVRGLRTMGTFTLELQQVFIELKIAPAANLQQTNYNPIANRELIGNRRIWEILKPHVNTAKNAQITNPPIYAIIGAPGSGKTTLLQHVALTLAANQQKQHGLPKHFTPLFLFLRNHTRTIIDKHPSLADLAQYHFSDPKKYPDLNPPPNWFEKQLKSRNCLVLLDGLDEVADLAQRQAVSAWVDNQAERYLGCIFIVTARPQGYLTAPLRQAHVLEVQPFNAQQVRRFIHAWYLANEVVSFGHKLDDGVRLRARQGADDLILRLNGMPTLTALTVNPLLLTMVAMVHRYRGQLPGRRVELYTEICDVLLGHWRQSIGVNDRLTAAQKRVVLQPLAAQMMLSKTRDINTAKAMAIIADPIESVGLSADEMQPFLYDVQAGSGLLLECEMNQWSFAHLTFQEYLTAAHLLEQKVPLAWNAFVMDSWWHETLLLYAAQGDATTLVRACLDNGSVVALTLAANCLEEARVLEKNVRDEVNRRLSLALESHEIERRHLAAKVKLNQRLHNLQRIDEYIEIDLHFLSCAEYQLFLDDYYAQGGYHQPDYWNSHTFTEGMAQQAIRGIRAEDAHAFCQWLTEIEGGELRYRLPTLEEARTMANQEGSLTWTCTQGEYVLFGTAEIEGLLLNTLHRVLPPSQIPFLSHLNAYFQSHHFELPTTQDDTECCLKRLNALDKALRFHFSALPSLQIKNMAWGLLQDMSLRQGYERAFNIIQTVELEGHTHLLQVAQDHQLIRELAKDIVLALDLAQDIVSAVALTRDISLAQPLDNRAFSRALVRIRELSKDLEELSKRCVSKDKETAFADVHYARDIAQQLAKALADDLAKARTYHSASERVRELIAARATALDRARMLAFILMRVLVAVHEFEPLYDKIEPFMKDMQRTITEWQQEEDIYTQRLAKLLLCLLEYLTVAKGHKLRVWQSYLAQLVEFILLGYQALQPPNSSTFKLAKVSWWLTQNDKVLIEQDKQRLHLLYWWLQINVARRQGHLSAWESLRLVRERLHL